MGIVGAKHPPIRNSAALAEKVAVLENAGYLQERAAHGNVDAALAVLDKAADQEPRTEDRIK